MAIKNFSEDSFKELFDAIDEKVDEIETVEELKQDEQVSVVSQRRDFSQYKMNIDDETMPVDREMKELIINSDGMLDSPNKPKRKNKYAILLDASSFAFKYYHGSNKKQHPILKANINMVELMILKILSHLKTKPNYLYVIWEGGKTYRHEIYPEYKAGRGEKEENYKFQANLLDKVLKSIGIPSFFIPKWEADDVIYSLVQDLKKKDPNMNIYVHTKDKDYFQMCDEKVFICRDRDDYYDKEKFEKKYKFPVNKFVNYLALMGDKSDNIPGTIKGFGEVGVNKLFQSGYYSLEDIYANLDTLLKQKIFRKGIYDFLVQSRNEIEEKWKLNLQLVQMQTMEESKEYVQKELFDDDSFKEKFTYQNVVDTIVQTLQIEKAVPFIKGIFNSNS